MFDHLARRLTRNVVSLATRKRTLYLIYEMETTGAARNARSVGILRTDNESGWRQARLTSSPQISPQEKMQPQEKIQHTKLKITYSSRTNPSAFDIIKEPHPSFGR